MVGFIVLTKFPTYSSPLTAMFRSRSQVHASKLTKRGLFKVWGNYLRRSETLVCVPSMRTGLPELGLEQLFANDLTRPRSQADVRVTNLRTQWLSSKIGYV